MLPTINIYQITHRSQETDCDWCGMPLYVGDVVWTDEPEMYACCSSRCRGATDGNVPTTLRFTYGILRQAIGGMATATAVVPGCKVRGKLFEDVLARACFDEPGHWSGHFVVGDLWELPANSWELKSTDAMEISAGYEVVSVSVILPGNGGEVPAKAYHHRPVGRLVPSGDYLDVYLSRRLR